MKDDNHSEIPTAVDESNQAPLIVEEETAEAGDRPNTCRSCGGSQFC